MYLWHLILGDVQMNNCVVFVRDVKHTYMTATNQLCV